MHQGQEMLRKAHGIEDTDLRKAGNAGSGRRLGGLR